uniref:Uncharacterized protein n=1 Tax=Melopsittacus undulatus TaxID=13146 RepID=A0A8V5GWE0_MELUD
VPAVSLPAAMALGPILALLGPILALLGPILALLGSLRLLSRLRNTCGHLRSFPCPPWRGWILGHMGMVRGGTEEGLEQAEALAARYRRGCLWWLLPWLPVLRLFHPDTLRPVLTAAASIAPKDQLFYGFLQPWLGDGLLLSHERKWVQHRRLLTPAFHGDLLKSYLGIFNHSTRIMHVSTHPAPAPVLSPSQPSEYIEAILELSRLVVRRQQHLLHYSWWLYRLSGDGRRFTQACATVHGFTAAVVQRRRQALQCLGHQAWLDHHRGQRMDFIDLLLLAKDEDGNALTDEDIAAEANTFMFAGHDTTASALAWLLYNLAGHQQHQERCRQEVQELLKGRDAEDIEWEDLSRLPFTTMCIKESLRLHPPVTAVCRCCTQDLATRDGRVIPKGTAPPVRPPLPSPCPRVPKGAVAVPQGSPA